MDAFILNSSKGLAEVTSIATVQFIHETIRDFPFEDGAKYFHGTARYLFVGYGHDRLTQCCVNYISSTQRALSESSATTGLGVHVTLPNPCSFPETSNQGDSPRREPELRSLVPQSPFIEYALSEVFHHANASDASGISQGLFLQNFSVQTWISLNDSLLHLQCHLSGSSGSHERYPPDSSLLYIVTEKNLMLLLDTVLRLGLYTDIDCGFCSSPLRLE